MGLLRSNKTARYVTRKVGEREFGYSVSGAARGPLLSALGPLYGISRLPLRVSREGNVAISLHASEDRSN